MNHHTEDNESALNRQQEIRWTPQEEDGNEEEERISPASRARAPPSSSLTFVLRSTTPPAAERVSLSRPPAAAAKTDHPRSSTGTQSKTTSPLKTSSNNSHASQHPYLVWLQQKKMKRMKEQLKQHEQQGDTRSVPTSFVPQRLYGESDSSSGRRRRTSLFEELLENGIEEEEASHRQTIYSMVKYAAGDLNDVNDQDSE